MEYRNLGRTGLKVSAISIGGWLTLGGTVGEDDSVSILNAAVEGGVNFIDLADIYARGRSEEAFGAFLKEYTRGAGRHRSDLVLSSKVFWPMSDNPNDRGLSRKHIIESCEKSLRRMRCDYLDLYFCHRFDETTPLEETVRAMDDLVRQGKVLYWGTSVWTGDQLRDAHGTARSFAAYAPVVEQPRYNLLDRSIEDDVVPACKELGMGLVVWSPLAQGLLTNKYAGGVPADSRGGRSDWLKEHLNDENIERVRRLHALALEHGTNAGALSLAWAMAQPGITSVITGATRVSQVQQNLRASLVEMTPTLAASIAEIFA